MPVALAFAGLVLRRVRLRPEPMELLAGLLAGAIVVLICRGRAVGFERACRVLRRTARHRLFWIVVFALLGPLIRLVLLPLAPAPFPVLHDDFVHLLGADTLREGRLANPPNRFPDHFETIYVIQKPTYSSSYPPGNAAFLALGWKLAGHPWFGVWLATALCCGAVAWMQYCWLPPLAAWIGGLVFSLTFGISSDWMNTFHGGAVPAAGGALLLGALPRLISTAKLRWASILSAGWILIWFTRPYESLILGLLVGATIFASLWRRRARLLGRRLAAATVLPAVVIVLGFAGSCYHNRRVTGHPLLSPYRLTQLVYGVPHGFIWQQEVSEPPGLTPQQHRIFLFQQRHFRTARSLARCWPFIGGELRKAWGFYLGYPMTVPFAIGLIAAGRKTRTMRLFLALGMAWSLLYPRLLPHYVSPLTAVFCVLASYGLLAMIHWRPRGRPWGAALALCFCLASGAAAARILYPWRQYGGPQPPTARVAAERRLEALPGLHLVFVRYGPNHSVHDEWVYNRADIDHAKVVWANDLGQDRNRQLIRYLGGRHTWLVEPDEGAVPEAYSDGGAPPGI